MQLDHIELSRLVISPANMRAKHKGRDSAELIPSIRARGILVPILVRPNGDPDVFEIVAGRRRFLAAKAVAETEGAPTLVPCAIMEPGDDLAALEASLIENVARLDADEVTQWETYAQLIKDGRTAADIAATFGLSDQVVRRVLALGNLLPRIRTLYRKEQIDPASIRQLTMATPAQQRVWLGLFDSPDQHAPTGRMLREWLFGGAAIRTSVALFDLAEYTAPIIADLFEEDSYFADNAMFWMLQNRAIEAKQDEYRANGWEQVIVLEPGRFFDSWNYEKRAKAKGGRVYITVSQQGAVEEHAGLVPRNEAQRLERPSDAPAKPRAEMSAPLRRYVDLHRHAVVRVRLLDQPWIALRAMLAHAIAGSPLWTVRCERQQADKAETEQSVMSSKAQVAFESDRLAVLDRLQLDAQNTMLKDALSGQSLPAVFDVLLGVPDEELMTLIPIVMGETLEAGGDAVEVLGRTIAPDIAELWQPDDAFFALLRDRAVLRALVEEVAGSDVAQGNGDAPSKVLKSILTDCLEGRNGRAKVESWVPRWLQFPASKYLEQEPAAEAETQSIAEPESADPE